MSEIQENLIEEGYEPNMICNRETENGDCKGILEYSESEMEAIGMGSSKSHLCCEECGFREEWYYPNKKEPHGMPIPKRENVLDTLLSISHKIIGKAKDEMRFSRYNEVYEQGFIAGANFMERMIMYYVNQAISELKR